jgi:hypothetical protein
MDLSTFCCIALSFLTNCYAQSLILYSDPLTSLSRYWMSSGTVHAVSDPSCLGGTSCVEMKGYSELYYNAFSLLQARSAVVGFNLCIGCTRDSASKTETTSSSAFYVYFQCAAAPYKLLKSYPSSMATARYPDQRLTLPPECDNVDAVNLVFTARSFTANVLIDSFIVTVDSDLATTRRPMRSVVERMDSSSSMSLNTAGPQSNGEAAMYTVAGDVGTERIEGNESGSTLRTDRSDQSDRIDQDSVLEAEAELSSTMNGVLDIDLDVGGVHSVSEAATGWVELEWSLKNWWMLYVTVFVMGIMIGSVSILLGLICLKREDKLDVSVRQKWTAFLCVFVMGILVGFALIAATIAFVLKLE